MMRELEQQQKSAKDEALRALEQMQILEADVQTLKEREREHVQLQMELEETRRERAEEQQRVAGAQEKMGKLEVEMKALQEWSEQAQEAGASGANLALEKTRVLEEELVALRERENALSLQVEEEEMERRRTRVKFEQDAITLQRALEETAALRQETAGLESAAADARRGAASDAAARHSEEVAWTQVTAAERLRVQELEQETMQLRKALEEMQALRQEGEGEAAAETCRAEQQAQIERLRVQELEEETRSLRQALQATEAERTDTAILSKAAAEAEQEAQRVRTTYEQEQQRVQELEAELRVTEEKMLRLMAKNRAQEIEQSVRTRARERSLARARAADSARLAREQEENTTTTKLRGSTEGRDGTGSKEANDTENGAEMAQRDEGEKYTPVEAASTLERIYTGEGSEDDYEREDIRDRPADDIRDTQAETADQDDGGEGGGGIGTAAHAPQLRPKPVRQGDIRKGRDSQE